jgi:hypothetical protein
MSTKNLPATEVQDVQESKMKIDAWEGHRRLFTIDENGQRVELQQATYRDYDADRAVRVARLGNSKIGVVSQNYQLVDHYQVAQPLLEAGFTSVDLLKHRADGIDMLAVLSHPDIVYEDTIGWDTHLFPTQDAKIHLAAKIDTSFRKGHGIRVTMGFMRVICKNGMVSYRLGLGNEVFSHKDFRTESLTNLVERTLRKKNPWERLTKENTIPSAALDWPIEQLERMAEDPTYVFTLPRFASAPLEKLTRQIPGWGVGKMAEVLKAARQAEDFSLLDVLNVVTDVAALRPDRMGSDGGPSWIMYNRLEPLTQHLIDVVDVGAFKAGLGTFPLAER